MKKIIFSLAAILLAAGVYAKDSTKVKKSPEEMAGKRADKLKTELSLSDDQRSKVYAALLETISKKQAIRERYKGSSDKKAMKAEMRSVHEGFDTSMKSILTSEQYTKWAEIKEKQKEKHKEKHKERKGKSQKATP
jgi:protein CpxP